MEPESANVLLNSIYGFNWYDLTQEENVYNNLMLNHIDLQKSLLKHVGEKMEEEFARFSMGGDKGIHMIRK